MDFPESHAWFAGIYGIPTMIFLCHIFGSENIWGWWCACKQRLNPFNSYRWMDMVSIINSQGVSRSSVTIMNIILNMIEHDRHQDHILCIQNSYATFFPSLFFIPGIVSGSSVGDLLSNIIFFKAKHLWNHEPNNHQPNHGSHHIYIYILLVINGTTSLVTTNGIP